MYICVSILLPSSGGYRSSTEDPCTDADEPVDGNNDLFETINHQITLFLKIKRMRIKLFT